MDVGALKEAIIDATELNGVYGKNLSMTKEVLLRIGDYPEKTYPLARVKISVIEGSFVMVLEADKPAPEKPADDAPGYHGEGELADFDPGTGRSGHDDWD